MNVSGFDLGKAREAAARARGMVPRGSGDASQGPSRDAARPGDPSQPIMMGMNPWDNLDVKWALPYAKIAIQFPFEKAAKALKDDVWRVDDDELSIINPATEKVLQWATWKLGIGEQVSHPLVAFAIALGGLVAMKLAVYKVHQSLSESGHPHNWQAMSDSEPSASNGVAANTPRPPLRSNELRVVSIPERRPPASSPSTMRRASQTVNGRTEEYEDEFSSAANPAPASPGSSTSAYVIVDE